MMRSPLYLIYGAALLGAMTFAQWRGWTFSPLDQGRMNPHSIRDNPGAYRPTYSGSPRYTGGK